MNIYKWENLSGIDLYVVIVLAHSLEEARSLLEPYHFALYEEPDEVYALETPVLVVDHSWDYERNWGDDL